MVVGRGVLAAGSGVRCRVCPLATSRETQLVNCDGLTARTLNSISEW